MKLSIIVPCYNEEKNIPLILEKFNNVIKNEEIEVILVNNGSTDKINITNFFIMNTFLSLLGFVISFYNRCLISSSVYSITLKSR